MAIESSISAYKSVIDHWVAFCASKDAKLNVNTDILEWETEILRLKTKYTITEKQHSLSLSYTCLTPAKHVAIACKRFCY